MIKTLFLIVVITLFCGCANHKPINFKPVPGVSIEIELSFDTLDFADNEVLIYKGAELLGSIKRVQNTYPSMTAMQALQNGFSEAAKGSRKPTVFSAKEGCYGFVVQTDNFSTLFVASEKETAAWAEISINKKFFPAVIATLK